jgi:hypothetical protein
MQPCGRDLGRIRTVIIFTQQLLVRTSNAKVCLNSFMSFRTRNVVEGRGHLLPSVTITKDFSVICSLDLFVSVCFSEAPLFLMTQLAVSR